jgi:hypothetical protein
MATAVAQVLTQCPIIVGKIASTITEDLKYIGVIMTEHEKNELVSKLTDYYNAAFNDGINMVYTSNSPHGKIVQFVDRLFADDSGVPKGPSYQESLEAIGSVYSEGVRAWGNAQKQKRAA